MISFPKPPRSVIQANIRRRITTALHVLLVTAALCSAPDDANTAVRYPEFSADGSKLALNLGNKMAILDIQTGDLIFLPVGRFSFVKSLRFTPDRKAVLLGKSNKRTAIYRFPSQRPFASLSTDGIVTVAVFLSGGRRVLIGLWDGRIEIWDYQQERRLVRTEGHMFGEVRLDVSDDERFVISAGDDQTVRLWRLDDLQFIRYMKDGKYGIKANKGMMRGVAFIDRGSAVLTTAWLKYCLPGNAPLSIFNVSEGRRIHQLPKTNGCGVHSEL